MIDLLQQIRSAAESDLYWLALFGALAIPDICGALESNNGEASGEKYKDWFDGNVADAYNGNLTGEDCYYYRCACLHQGRSANHRSRYSRIIFIEPDTSGFIAHNNILNDELNIDVKIFCEDIVSAAETWLTSNEGTAQYIQNASKFMSRHTNGLIRPATFIG